MKAYLGDDPCQVRFDVFVIQEQNQMEVLRCLSWVQNYETEVWFPLVVTHWNILHPPHVTEELNASPQILQITERLSRPQKSPLAKSDFSLKVEMGSEHLLWRPQITLPLIKSWSERMPETHGKVLPFWPSHHNIWKQEDWRCFRRVWKRGRCA